MKSVKFNIPEDRGTLYEVIKYPAGETQVRLTSVGIISCSEKVEYVISANPIPDLIELAQLKSALDGLGGWHYRILELMYLPYARADRRFVQGDSHGLEMFGKLINAMEFDVVYTFDVHSVAAHVLVKNLINLDPILHYDQITPVIKKLGKNNLALVVPDKGAQRRYDLLKFDLPLFVGEKTRDAGTGKLSGFQIDYNIKNYKKALIVDDICDGGGTFIGLAEEIHRLNPEIELSLYVSHGIFSQGFRKLNTQFDDRIFVSDFTLNLSKYSNWKQI